MNKQLITLFGLCAYTLPGIAMDANPAKAARATGTFSARMLALCIPTYPYQQKKEVYVRFVPFLLPGQPSFNQTPIVRMSAEQIESLLFTERPGFDSNGNEVVIPTIEENTGRAMDIRLNPDPQEIKESQDQVVFLFDSLGQLDPALYQQLELPFNYEASIKRASQLSPEERLEAFKANQLASMQSPNSIDSKIAQWQPQPRIPADHHIVRMSYPEKSENS